MSQLFQLVFQPGEPVFFIVPADAVDDEDVGHGGILACGGVCGNGATVGNRTRDLILLLYPCFLSLSEE